jgi:hypothetical protein
MNTKTELHGESGKEPEGEPSRLCHRCQALEARVAELESALAGAGAADVRGGDTVPAAEATPAAILAPLEFKALRVVAPAGWGAGWALRPSPQRRQWMNENPHAYHCLPLVIANQWGWQVLCPTDVTVTWDGTPGLAGLRVNVDPRFAGSIKSQFGSGIVTFSPPWLFRTSPGWDLYVKGPSNRWKPNCFPLEGVVETWWLNYTFTLNWKLVEPGTVAFAQGESLAQLVPVPHATFTASRAVEAPIGFVEPAAGEELLRWREERRRIADTPDRMHKLYRRAEGVDQHLQRVPVPEVEPMPVEGMQPPASEPEPGSQ